MRRVAGFTEVVCMQRHVEARSDIVAKGYSAQELRAVAALALSHGERRGNHRAAGVAQRRCVRVVSLVGMGKHAVRQRREFSGRHDA